jgi:integrase
MTIDKGMQINLEQRKPFDKFMDFCSTYATKKDYSAALKRFMQHYEIRECEELLKLSTEELEDIIINYIKSMKNNNRSEGLVTQQIAGVRKFLSSNRINLNWDFINQYKGEFRRKQKDEAYTREQIQTLLQICDIRTRVIVLVFASAGIRIGALPDLRLKHIKKVNDLYRFTIYEGYKQQYITFCTPECTAAIDSYLAFRQRQGEKLIPESYLIRQQFDINDLDQIRLRSKPVTASTIRNIVWNCLIKSGIREVNHNADRTHRKNIAELQGFRKFFTSQCVNANLNSEKRMLLEGHSLKGNDNSYVRITEQELLQEYLKVVNDLTIDPANRLRRKVEKLEVEKNKYDALAADIEALKKKVL